MKEKLTAALWLTTAAIVIGTSLYFSSQSGTQNSRVQTSQLQREEHQNSDPPIRIIEPAGGEDLIRSEALPIAVAQEPAVTSSLEGPDGVPAAYPFDPNAALPKLKVSACYDPKQDPQQAMSSLSKNAYANPLLREIDAEAFQLIQLETAFASQQFEAAKEALALQGFVWAAETPSG